MLRDCSTGEIVEQLYKEKRPEKLFFGAQFLLIVFDFIRPS